MKQKILKISILMVLSMGLISIGGAAGAENGSYPIEVTHKDTSVTAGINYTGTTGSGNRTALISVTEEAKGGTISIGPSTINGHFTTGDNDKGGK